MDGHYEEKEAEAAMISWDEAEKYTEIIRSYIMQHTGDVLKKPRSFIRYPFIDPGSIYDGNVWDWDTYWSVYGFLNLLNRYEEDGVKESLIEHAKGNVRNFFDHQLPDGYIPMMIEVADWPEPYLNMRHKEGKKMNMHKPFLAGQICLISSRISDYSWAAEFQEGLLRYFACYEENYFHENSGLYVWQDDIMIGMDNDPATFGRPPFSTANIFLNSFMCVELQNAERYFLALAALKGKENEADTLKGIAASFRKKRDSLVEAIQAECWDRRDRFFYSVDVEIHTRKYDWFHQGLGVFWKTLPIKIRAWSGFIPMYAQIASKEQAEALVKHIFDPETFGSDYGVTTLSKDEKMFDLSATNNPSNWLGPVWLVANYVVFRGLLNYGYRKEAEWMFRKTALLLGRDLVKNGSLHEYYDPFSGEPVMNGGFINWNILVLNMYDELILERTSEKK